MLVLNINKFHYLRGGAERYYFALTKLLEDHGHDVIPFSMNDERNFDSTYSKYFVSNLELKKPGLKLLNKISRPIWSKEAKTNLEKLLDKHHPDIAHINLLYHHLSPSILPLLKSRGIPIIMTIHDYKLICPNYKLYTKGSPCQRCKGHKYYNAIAFKCLKNSYAVSTLAAIEMSVHKLMQVYEKQVDTFIATSQFVKDIHVDFGQDPGNIVVIPHFIDPAFLELAKIKRAYRAKEPYMLYFGRLAEEKGVDKMLEMMYIYKPDLKLKLAGSGPLDAYLRQYVKDKKLQDRVEFLDHLSAGKLIAYIKGARLVLMPSRFYEAFGFSALESIALGTPLVASDLGALKQLVTEEVGKVFPAEDLSDMADAIKEVATWDKAAVAQAGQQLIQSRYLPEKHYQSLQTIYTHLVLKGSLD